MGATLYLNLSLGLEWFVNYSTLNGVRIRGQMDWKYKVSCATKSNGLGMQIVRSRVGRSNRLCSTCIKIGVGGLSFICLAYMEEIW